MQVSTKKIIGVILAILFVIVAVIFFNDFRKARLTIISEEGAEIYATTDRGVAPSQIGTTQATLKTGSTDRVYVLVQKDGRVTQAVYTLGNGERREVNLELSQLQEKTTIANAALSNIFIESDFVIGTDPITQEILPVSRTSSLNIGVDYQLVTALDDIDWINRSNFVYDAFGSGVAYFNDGLVKQISGGLETDGEFVLFYQDYATQNPSGDILLLNGDELYKANGVGDDKPTLLTKLDTNSDSELFSVNDKVVSVTPNYEEIITNPEQEGQSEFAAVSYNFIVINYRGEALTEFSIDTGDIVEEVVGFGSNGYAILTDKDVYLVDINGVVSDSLPLFFEQAQDIGVVGDDLVLLNRGGIWLYKTNSQTLHLMASYSGDEKYAPKSMQIGKQSIIYSVLVIPDEVEVEEDALPFSSFLEDAPEDKPRENGFIYSIPLP